MQKKLNPLKVPLAFFVVFFLWALAFVPAVAEGLTSASGNDLPLGAGGSGPYVTIKEGTGNVGVKTTAPQATLEVNGGLRIGADATCNGTKTGTLSYVGGVLYVCSSSGWKTVPVKP